MSKFNKSILKVSKEEAEKKLQEMISHGEDIQNKKTKDIKTWKKNEKNFNAWNAENYETLKKIFLKNTIAKDYAKSFWRIGQIFLSDLKLEDKSSKLKKDIELRINKLVSIKKSLQVLIEDVKKDTEKNKIFFFYGTNSEMKDEVLEFLEKLGLEPITLNELAAAGKTLIDLIQGQSKIKHALALLTPDNIGGCYSRNPGFFSNQNVILELGIFIGTFGRKNVFALYKENVNLPADYHGFEYIKIDDTDAWKHKLKTSLSETELKLD